MEALTSPGLLDHGGMLNAFGGLRDNATAGLGVWVSTRGKGGRGGVANPAVGGGRGQHPKSNPSTQLVSFWLQLCDRASWIRGWTHGHLKHMSTSIPVQVRATTGSRELLAAQPTWIQGLSRGPFCCSDFPSRGDLRRSQGRQPNGGGWNAVSMETRAPRGADW